MSVQCITWVLQHSETEERDRLCLLILANYADEDGLAWPGIPRIAHDMRCSERTAQRAVHSLAEGSHIEIISNGAPDLRIRFDRRPNAYRLVLERGDISVTPSSNGVTAEAERGDTPGSHGVSPVSPKPSVEPSVDPEPTSSLVPLAARIEKGSDNDPEFVAFWAAYPSKKDKGGSRKAWRAALKKAPAAVIIEGVRRFAADPNLPPEAAFIPHPKTWLNGERWNDGPLPSRIRRSGSRDGAEALLDEMGLGR